MDIFEAPNRDLMHEMIKYLSLKDIANLCRINRGVYLVFSNSPDKLIREAKNIIVNQRVDRYIAKNSRANLGGRIWGLIDACRDNDLAVIDILLPQVDITRNNYFIIQKALYEEKANADVFRRLLKDPRINLNGMTIGLRASVELKAKEVLQLDVGTDIASYLEKLRIG